MRAKGLSQDSEYRLPSYNFVDDLNQGSFFPIALTLKMESS